jgi:hypothetical protein
VSREALGRANHIIRAIQVNSEFLGDAFDHWKGSLIRTLSQQSLIRNVTVDPMITDETAWSEQDLNTYRRLLSLDSSNSVCHGESTFCGDRYDYFSQVPQDIDVFLDPDTGIATSGASRDHVKISELGTLLGNSDRLLMVYQHSARGSFHGRLEQIQNKLSEGVPGIHCCIYECGRVAMFFLSMTRSRVQSIQAALTKFLSGTAEVRIHGPA